MKLTFHKYHGAGNDFILFDQMDRTWLEVGQHSVISRLCDRHFGIGADGLILLQSHAQADFEMVYFNADGHPGSMCGNGGRCAVSMAYALGYIGENTSFIASDGLHEAVVRQNGAWIELSMRDVGNATMTGSDYFLDTGSPHYVSFRNALDKVEVVREGRAIRNLEPYRKAGTNVNFVAEHEDGIRVYTYERGVEDETLACGTGITASAIAYAMRHPLEGQRIIPVEAKGGQLEVRFLQSGDRFSDIWLCGPARKVFEGEVEVDVS